METMSVAEARRVESVGKEATLRGWVRTRRDSKGGFSFLELNDGSCLGNVQVVAEAALPNYQSEVLKLSAGCSVTVRGAVRASPAKGQPTEVLAREIVVHGWADPATYPLQKKGHTLEFLREMAHLRPRSEHLRRRGPRAQSGVHVDPSVLPGARLFVHPPADHHGQRLRGRRPDVPRHHPRPGQAAAQTPPASITDRTSSAGLPT